VVFSVAATAGLVGGVGAAVGAVPVSLGQPKASALSARPPGDPARKAERDEAAWLKAKLARTSGDGERLRAQIAHLEAATVRAQRVRAEKIQAQIRQALQMRQRADELAQQREVLAATQQANAGQASYVASKAAARPATGYAPVRPAAARLRATRSPAPSTHARTGASGAATSSHKDTEDSEHESGGSDD
jgi:hypothetical protein